MQQRTISYLGRHTSIGYLGPDQWNKIPYLKDNGGCLPPFIIAVGDTRRVTKARSSLRLKDPLLLHEESERLLGLTGRGRVDVVVGRFEHKGKSIPLTIVETQMGMPSTDIILREILAHSHLCYNFGKEKVEVKGFKLIRVGTAGGINKRRGGKKLNIGDIVNAQFSIGWSGAVLQSIAGLDYSSKKVISDFRKKWALLGNTFTDDGRFPKAFHSKKIIRAINASAKELGLTCHTGGNFSKDSLYAEIDTDAFLDLREKYGVMSTEMEQMVLSKLASDLNALGVTLHTGLVSGVIGVLPDSSFESGEEFKEKIEKVEGDSLLVAAVALWKLYYEQN